MRIAEQKPTPAFTTLNLVTVMWLTGLTRSSALRLAKEGTLPPPVLKQPLRWRWLDILLWNHELQSRIASYCIDAAHARNARVSSGVVRQQPPIIRAPS